ncbi:MAG: TetR/AcrR family transcriptional regulator [Marmoricola sp.]
MRADARRNHELLLDAARDVFVERGPEAPLDEIARRAGVGIATLYRRFPDRRSLMQAVVLNALTLTAEAAERANDLADPLAALASYVHAVIDLRTSAVIPTLLDQLDLDEPDVAAARQRSAKLSEQLVARAQKTGALREGVTFGDVGLMLVRLSRPLPGNFTPELQIELAHRHADLFLAGLHADGAYEPVHGPALELADLQKLRPKA